MRRIRVLIGTFFSLFVLSLLLVRSSQASESLLFKVKDSQEIRVQVEYPSGAYYEMGKGNPIYVGLSKKGYRYYSAILFNKVSIPVGAVIKKAYLKLSPAWWQDRVGVILIYGQEDSDGQLFSDPSFKIKNTKDWEGVSWYIAQPMGSRGYLETPDLSRIISKMVSRPSWEGEGSFIFYLNGGQGGSWAFDSYASNAKESPQLIIEYELPSELPSQPFPSPVVEEEKTWRIKSGADDAYQLYGQLARSPNYLKIGYVYQAGFRFTGVGIPRGAEVLEAKLQLASPWYYSGKDGIVKICVEASSQPLPISIGKLSKRSVGPCATWRISGDWKTGQYRSSVDLSQLVQEVINRNDWKNGGSLAFIFKENYNTYWPITPFEVNPEKAARLTVRYRYYPISSNQPPVSPTPTPTPIESPQETVKGVLIGYPDKGRQVAVCRAKVVLEKSANTSFSRLDYFVDGYRVGSVAGQRVFYLNTASLQPGEHRLRVAAYEGGVKKGEGEAEFYVSPARLDEWWRRVFEEIKKMEKRGLTKTSVLMLHKFSEDFKDEETLTYDQLYCLLSNLESEGYNFVNLGEFYRLEKGEINILRPVLIAMDDIHISQYKALKDILPLFGQKAVLAAPATWVGQDDRLGVSQLRELSGMGYDVQSHTYNHYRLTRLSESDLSFELSQSKAFLEKLLGKKVSLLVYPYGAVNDLVKQKAKKLGYEAAFLVDNYWRSSDLYSVARVFIKGNY